MRFVSLAALAVALLGCGAKVLPPLRFADSDSFSNMASRVYAILEADIDGDGIDDAVIAERSGYGYRVALLLQHPGKKQVAFEPSCAGPVLAGDELEAFRWMRLGQRDVLFALVATEDPDEKLQNFALVDVADGCKVAYREELRLPAAQGELVLPTGLRGGAFVQEDGASVGIVDEPRFLRLFGASGEVDVLTSVRQRIVRDWHGGLRVREQVLTTVAPQKLAVHFEEDSVALGAEPPVDAVTRAAAAPRLLAELTDASDAAFIEVGRGTLVLTAAEPILLLEVHYGCGAGGEERPPELHLGDLAHVLGAPPAPASWVRGFGSSTVAGTFRRELLLLTEPRNELRLDNQGQARLCLREIVAHRFRR